MPFFICPNCGNREASGDRTAGLSQRPKGCSKCGFGFVFELLDDYYPAPDAAFFTCDKSGRVLDVGKGGFELTGLTDEDVIGRGVKEVLGLEWIDAGDGFTISTSCNWTAKQNFISRTYTVDGEEGFLSSGLQIIGWDAKQRAIRSWLFDSPSRNAARSASCGLSCSIRLSASAMALS